jgi:hypothetical protein
MAKNGMIVNIFRLELSIYEGTMTLSLEHMTRLLLGILTVNSAARARIPRLDLMALNDRDLADLNLPADVRSRLMGQRLILDSRQRG